MAFARWDPLGDLLALQQQLDRVATTSSGWVPPVDLFETADGYVLTAEVPGLTRDDIRIEMSDGLLTLSGRRQDPPVACEQYHRIERGHGTFSRSFHLPLPVTIEAITADLKDGLLTVLVPKADVSPARRIHVL